MTTLARYHLEEITDEHIDANEYDASDEGKLSLTIDGEWDRYVDEPRQAAEIVGAAVGIPVKAKPLDGPYGPAWHFVSDYTLSDLARDLHTTVDTIMETIEDGPDGIDFWATDAGVTDIVQTRQGGRVNDFLTPEGAGAVRDAVAASGGDPAEAALDALADIAARLDETEALRAERDDMIRDLAAAGVPQQDIADAAGVTRMTVYNVTRRDT